MEGGGPTGDDEAMVGIIPVFPGGRTLAGARTQAQRVNHCVEERRRQSPKGSGEDGESLARQVALRMGTRSLESPQMTLPRMRSEE